MKIVRRILSPSVWYLPLGILWVYFLNTYASNPDKTLYDWDWHKDYLLWAIWAAIGISLVAGIIDVYREPRSLRCRLAIIALLGSSSSALLMVAGFIPRFVFGAFFIVMIGLGITFFRAKIQTDKANGESDNTQRWSFTFLGFMAVILGAFFVGLLVDIREGFQNIIDLTSLQFVQMGSNAFPVNALLVIEEWKPLFDKAEFSVYGLVAYSLIGGSIVLWETLLSPQRDSG